MVDEFKSGIFSHQITAMSPAAQCQMPLLHSHEWDIEVQGKHEIGETKSIKIHHCFYMNLVRIFEKVLKIMEKQKNLNIK
jgi:6-pyruvoyl-tetrahydropterin synthase